MKQQQQLQVQLLLAAGLFPLLLFSLLVPTTVLGWERGLDYDIDVEGGYKRAELGEREKALLFCSASFYQCLCVRGSIEILKINKLLKKNRTKNPMLAKNR
jgi:hypothetical protein